MKKKDKGGQTFTSTVKITKMLLGMVWRQPLGRVYLVLKFFISVLNAVIPTVYTVFSGLIINELTGGLRIDRLITYVAVMVVTPTVMFFINHFYSKYELILQSELMIRFEADFFGNVLDMDYENLEIPAIQVKKIRANTTVMGLLRVVNMISGAVAALFSLIAVTSIISTLNPVILIVMIAVIIVNYIVSKDNDRKVYELDRERSKKEMVSSVYRYMLEDAKSAKEVRMFAMKDFLIDNYSEQQRASSAVRLKIFNKQSVSSYVGAAMDLIKEASLYAVVLFEVLKRALPIGNMTIYMASARQFSGAVSGVMHSYRTLSSNSLQTRICRI